ncbi:uncharacterized protein LOC134840159 [Symsagittifera roscoffensis]|uniref:uncharacterized protein LOC134840159 n=1 Tax=Symsagittifera roscoffensis TaxID=84072 RepID=UPI00307B63E4
MIRMSLQHHFGAFVCIVSLIWLEVDAGSAVTWFQRGIMLEAKLMPEFEPFIEEYLDPTSEQFNAVKVLLEHECGLAELGDQFYLNCTLYSLSEGSVYAQFSANISSEDWSALRLLSPYHVEYELQQQVHSFRIVFLESDFNGEEQDRKWQWEHGLIVVGCFMAVVCFAILYVPLDIYMTRRDEQASKNKLIQPKLNQKIAMKMELVKERRKEEERMEKEEAAERAAMHKAFLAEEFKKKKDLEAMRINALNDEIRQTSRF